MTPDTSNLSAESGGMEISKETVAMVGEFLARVGFPTGGAVWLLYEFHIFARELVVNQALILKALQELVAIHK